MLVGGLGGVQLLLMECDALVVSMLARDDWSEARVAIRRGGHRSRLFGAATLVLLWEARHAPLHLDVHIVQDVNECAKIFLSHSATRVDDPVVCEDQDEGNDLHLFLKCTFRQSQVGDCSSGTMGLGLSPLLPGIFWSN